MIDQDSYHTADSLFGALNFTLDDLDSNRQGIMTERQKIELLEKNNEQASETIAAYLLVSFVAVLSIWSLLSGDSQSLPFFGMLSIVGIFILARIRIMERPARRDRKNGTVASVSGAAKISFFRRGRYVSQYNLQIEDKIFRIPQWAVLLFNKDKHYRLFYAVESGVLLSAEQLP